MCSNILPTHCATDIAFPIDVWLVTFAYVKQISFPTVDTATNMFHTRGSYVARGVNVIDFQFGFGTPVPDPVPNVV